MFSWRIVFAALVLAAAGCSSDGISWTSNRAISGNHTGGFVPAAVTNENEQMEMARKHCAQYDRVMRPTALPKDTGGKLIFMCDKPGQIPEGAMTASPGSPPPGSPGVAQNAAPGQLPPGVRMKKQ